MMKYSGIFAILLSFLVACFNYPASGQDKIPLDHSVYDHWQVLKNPLISNDGKQVVFEIDPQKGDGNLVLYHVGSTENDTLPRGALPSFMPNSDVLVFRIKPQFDLVRRAKLKKLKKDKMPKDSLGIWVIGSKKLIKFPNLESFSVPEKGSDWIAFLMKRPEPAKAGNDTTSHQKEKPKKKKKEGKLLVIYNPLTGDSVTFGHITHYAFSKNGQACAMIRMNHDTVDSVSVSVYDIGKRKLINALDRNGFSKNISLDEKGEQMAFTFSADTAKQKAYGLYYFNPSKKKLLSVSGKDFSRLTEGWSVSEYGKVFFNKKGDELYFGVVPGPVPVPKDTLTEDEKVSLDIWNWQDSLLQPQQLKQLDREKKRNYMAVYFPKNDKIVQLGGPQLEDVSVNPKAENIYSLGFDDRPYRKMISWSGNRYEDVYLVNRQSGERKKILEKVASYVSLSPAQHYVAWYNIADSSWNIYNIKTGVDTNVTGALDVNFYNEWNDVPKEAGAYGYAGWTENEDLVLYDRYDLWLIDPSGKNKPLNLTKGEGRKNKVQLRYRQLDREETHLANLMLLSAFNEKNKDAGYYHLSLKDNTLNRLIMEPAWFKNVKKAKEANRLIWQRETFTDYPDLYISNADFSNKLKISTANPQQEKYIWGTTELVNWVSFDGDSVQGIMVKPENFDPSKKYPMLVYFYERSSQRLNRYYIPKPIRSVINWTYYASNGYLIFIPDIKYKVGYPGPSAFNYIVSGTQSMCDRYPFIDRSRLGIQGQSWGGYETAYVITQTAMFRAAMAGAPVSNMTSAYGGIRWGSGLSRAFQYEETQSRIGGTLWDKLPLYMLNSPLFSAERIETPLLMMHNDHDGAVPWYQGIEFFNALRRLNKPVWMLVYNGAPHNLSRWADMEDLTKRMQQFFDYYLKGAPKPVWMKYGIPAIEKGKNFGFSLDNQR